MNWNVMLEVVMSMVFFAPVLIVFAAFLFAGVLVVLEGAVAFGKRHAPEEEELIAEAPPVGPIVAGLKAAIEEEAQATHATAAKGKAANE